MKKIFRSQILAQVFIAIAAGLLGLVFHFLLT